MKVVVGALALALAVVAWITWIDHQEVSKLRANFAAVQNTGAGNETEKCAAQAEKTFRSYGYASDISSLNNSSTKQFYTTADFESRFNRKLNKCFVQIDSTLNNFETQMLLDAYERRSYGEITFNLAATDQSGLPTKKVISCTVDSDSKSPRQCKSEEEYDALVSSYWQN